MLVSDAGCAAAWKTLPAELTASDHAQKWSRIQDIRLEGAHLEAALALHVHEKGIGALNDPLELVRALLKLRRRMQQVDVRM